MKLTIELIDKFKWFNDVAYIQKGKNIVAYYDIEHNTNLIGFEFVYDDVNRCIKRLVVQSDTASEQEFAEQRKNNHIIINYLTSIEPISNNKKIRVNKTIFKILSFFNLCEEV